MKNYGIGKCKGCGIEIKKSSANQLWCGSRKLRTGCAHKDKRRRSLIYRTKYKDRIWASYLKYKPFRKRRDPNKERDYMYKKNYGMSLEKFNEMVLLQKNLCAICFKPQENYQSQHLCVDHDHVTGKVRGLLCNKCNRALGMFNDDIKKLKNAVKYLKKHDLITQED